MIQWGLTGKGTQHTLFVTYDNGTSEEIIWYLTEEESVIKHGNSALYQNVARVFELKSQKALEEKHRAEQSANQAKAKKSSDLESRCNNDLQKSITDVLDVVLLSNIDLTIEYKSGKEKAINSLVGRAMKYLKTTGIINIDRLSIKSYILLKLST